MSSFKSNENIHEKTPVTMWREIIKKNVINTLTIRDKSKCNFFIF